MLSYMKSHGAFFLRPPNAGPVFRNALAATELPQIKYTFQLYTHGVFLHVDAPTSVRIHPSKEFTPIPCPGAVYIPAFATYTLDTRMTPPTGWHRWLHIECIEYSPAPLPGVTATSGGFFSDPEGYLATLLDEAMKASLVDDGTGYWTVHYLGGRIIAHASQAKHVKDNLYLIRPPKQSIASERLVTRTIAFLGAHLRESFTVGDIARAVRVSPSTLAHTYRSTAGEPPMKTLRRMRLQEAKRLLVAGYPHDSIAEATGFADARHFAREFKRDEGLSPSHFIQKLEKIMPKDVSHGVHRGH